MDVLKDNLFEEKKAETIQRPFPDDDYDKKGSLRSVRGRILGKLLKYELKFYFKPMLIVMIALFTLASLMFTWGIFMQVEDFTGESVKPGRMIAWVFGVVIFGWGAMVATVFPVGMAMWRYHKQFFTSQAYLTLSIPATPEEHILSKRIAAYIAMAISVTLVIAAVVFAMLPLVNIFIQLYEPSYPSYPSDPTYQTDLTTGVFHLLYLVIQCAVSPALLLALCGGFCCWRHRGLKVWMIVLMVIGIYFTSIFLGVFFGTFLVEMPIEVWNFIIGPGKWIGLVIDLGILYLLFRYETQTLRNKINLK